jgi:hypothetical protein
VAKQVTVAGSKQQSDEVIDLAIATSLFSLQLTIVFLVLGPV